MSPGSCLRGWTWGVGCQTLELLGFEMAPFDQGGGSSYIMHIRLNMHGVQVYIRIVSEYYQEIPQSQTADNPRGRAAQSSRNTRKTN